MGIISSLLGGGGGGSYGASSSAATGPQNISVNNGGLNWQLVAIAGAALFALMIGAVLIFKK